MTNNKINLPTSGELEESKELAVHYMKTLVEVARESFLILDRDLRVISANDVFYQSFQVTPAQTENKLLYELGNGQWNIPELKKLLEEILPEKKVVKDYEVTHFFETIGEKTIVLNARQIDTVQLIILAMEDISARKEFEKKIAEGLQNEILKNMTEGIYLIRVADGTIVYTNPKFEKMFGYEPDEMLGKKVAIVNAPTNKKPEETAKEIMDSIVKTGEWHGEVNNIKKDGTSFWCYANVSVFDHPKYGKVFVSVHTDITDRKKAQESLEKFNKVMVGRELQMKNLKQEIVELKNKLAEKDK